jgi:hypothetical protein
MTRNQIKYEVKMYYGKELKLHTWHTTEFSKDIEVAAAKERIKKKQLTHLEVISFGKTERIF